MEIESRKTLELQLSSRSFQLARLEESSNCYVVYRGTQTESSKNVYVTVWRSTEPEVIAAKCELHSKLNNLPNIVKMIDHFQFEHSGLLHYVSVTEYIEKDLFKEITLRRENNKPWSEEELMETARSLIQTLAQLKENGLTHYCHLRNIYITGNRTAKVGNFHHLATIDSEPCDLQEVTIPDYISPEQYSQPNGDVYSLGKTLLCCYRLETEEWNIGPKDLSELVAEVEYAELRELLRKMMDNQLDMTQLWHLVQRRTWRDELREEAKHPISPFELPKDPTPRVKDREESVGNDIPNSDEIGLLLKPRPSQSIPKDPNPDVQGEGSSPRSLIQRGIEEVTAGNEIPSSNEIGLSLKPSPRQGNSWREFACCCCCPCFRAKHKVTNFQS